MPDSNKTHPNLSFVKRGEPFVWVTGTALAIVLAITIGMLLIILVNGMSAFWARGLAVATLQDDTQVMGEIWDREQAGDENPARRQFKIGNRKLNGLDFQWVDDAQIQSTEYPRDAATIERTEYGNFYGFFQNLTGDNEGDTWQAFLSAWEETHERAVALDDYDDQIVKLNYQLERERLARVDRGDLEEPDGDSEVTLALAEIEGKKQALLNELATSKAMFHDVAGSEVEIALLDIVRPYRPNEMSIVDKGVLYLGKIRELLLDEPREANTEGGLFPAIFGTILLVFLMSIFSFPLGVVAGVYLREYAREGLGVRIVRIAVNNLAGVPSIVYGIFGLGFFVYGVGGFIDELFFSERLPTSTFGRGGILWASLTLGLLTVPVVIVATEEALGAIPAGVREGSLALGATKFQTLLRILLPMASPGIMTGFILSMARAAGEVAPLMITGVVKLAPALPIDGNFPYFHAERQFMHLGFHIYDVGYQSPNVEASKPMVYVTTLLLILIVLTMSAAAIWLRDRMKKKYTTSEF